LTKNQVYFGSSSAQKNKNITLGGFLSKQELLFNQAEGHDAW
jgi:hypothetical protein